MKSTMMAVAVSASLASVAWAQPGPWGPGGGYGPGWGEGGYGPGYGMGPGMGDHGPGHGMGPGMGRGGYGMGPGARLAGLDLSDPQRTKIGEIRRETRRKQWELMGRVHEQRDRLHELFTMSTLDDGAARKAFTSIQELRKQMFESRLDARKRIDAVLTPEQREQLRRGGRGGGGGAGGPPAK